MAELAHRFGTEVGMPKCAKAAGLLHDFGKYSEAFQNVLTGTATSVDHAVCAAAYLYGSGKTAKPAYRMIAEAAAAHHSALRSFESMATELRDICRGEGSGVCWPGKKSALFGPGQFIEAQRAFARDFSDFKFTAEHFEDTSADRKMLRERMLFSCMVDADYTASSGRSADDGAALEPGALLSRLYDHMDELRKGSGSDKALNRIRDEVFQRCGEAGDMYEHDHSASKGEMSVVSPLIIFKHVGTDTNEDQRARQAKLGCAPAHKLFDLVHVRKKADVEFARSYRDYDAEVDVSRVPAGVEIGFQSNPYGPIYWRPLPEGEDWFRLG